MHSVFSKCPTKLSARFSNLDGSRSIRVSRCSNSSRPRGMKRIDEESLSGYIPETYCPIEPGGKLGPSYTALVKLGYGRTSTTWLCKDHISTYKVLKVGAVDATRREKTTFERIRLASTHSKHRGSICVRRPERVFEFDRKGQMYNCFVFEPLGPNLLESTNRPANRPFSTQNVRFTAAYLLHALEFLHANGIAHTDIKLDKIQLTLPEEQDLFLDAFYATEKSSPSLSKKGKDDVPVFASREMEQDELGFPILCDLGSAVFDEDRYPSVVQALPYRAPEVILGAAWDHKIDVWNFGVLVWELLFAERLFGNTDERASMETMIRYLGLPPKSFLERCRHCEAFFDGDGIWRHETIDAITLEDRIEEGTSGPELFDFLRCALQWDPRDRASAAQLLEHDWLKL